MICADHEEEGAINSNLLASTSRICKVVILEILGIQGTGKKNYDLAGSSETDAGADDRWQAIRKFRWIDVVLKCEAGFEFADRIIYLS